MNRDEFRCWFDYHQAAFSGLQGWLSKQPDRQTTLGLWMRVLERVSLEDAKDATEKLMSGEVETPKYFGFDDHPRWIVKICRDTQQDGSDRFPQGKFVTGQDGKRVWAFHCHKCEDTGFVAIWLQGAFRCYRANPEAFKQFQDGHWLVGPDGKPSCEWCYHTTTIRCTCERGQAFGYAWCKVQYDEGKHARVFKNTNGDVIDSLTGWMPPAPVAEEFDVRSYVFKD